MQATMAPSSSTGSLRSSMTATTTFQVWDPEVVETRRRSAQLMADPKAKELSHFIGSKHHEARLREAAGLDGEDMREAEAAAKVIMETPGADDSVDRFDPLARCKARLEWRAEMDRNIRRLLQDTDLMMDDRMHDTSKHGLRCTHLDKTYAWFEKHGKKEAGKERPAPPFLKFDNSDRPMPGSLRADPTLCRGSAWAPQQSFTAKLSMGGRGGCGAADVFARTAAATAAPARRGSEPRMLAWPGGAEHQQPQEPEPKPHADPQPEEAGPSIMAAAAQTVVGHTGSYGAAAPPAPEAPGHRPASRGGPGHKWAPRLACSRNGQRD